MNVDQEKKILEALKQVYPKYIKFNSLCEKTGLPKSEVKKIILYLQEKRLVRTYYVFDFVSDRLYRVSTNAAGIDYLAGKEEIEEKKIFQEAEDKLKEAGVSFSKDDWPSVINNLNTFIELALKDKFDIPATITKINTNKIIEICIAHKFGPVEHFEEIQKHVLAIDNKVKHQGYSPSKKDCIDAIKAAEEFLKQMKKYSFNVTAEIKEKIYSGV